MRIAHLLWKHNWNRSDHYYLDEKKRVEETVHTVPNHLMGGVQELLSLPYPSLWGFLFLIDILIMLIQIFITCLYKVKSINPLNAKKQKRKTKPTHQMQYFLQHLFYGLGCLATLKYRCIWPQYSKDPNCSSPALFSYHRLEFHCSQHKGSAIYGWAHWSLRQKPNFISHPLKRTRKTGFF